jgi:hypothetical protein
MIKKLIPLFLLLSLCLISSVNAKTIIWVCMNQDGDGDGSVLNDFQEFTDGLTAAGYTVDIRPGYWTGMCSRQLKLLSLMPPTWCFSVAQSKAVLSQPMPRKSHSGTQLLHQC